MNRKKIFLCVFGASVLINVIIMIICRERAAITAASFCVACIMLLYIINGVYCYYNRHETDVTYMTVWRDYMRYRDRPFLRVPEVDTYSKEYMDRLLWHFCVYWFTIPFYIPCAFLIPPDANVWWFAFVFLVLAPYMVYLVDVFKDNKKHKMLAQQRDRELKEQKLREELGHYK